MYTALTDHDALEHEPALPRFERFCDDGLTASELVRLLESTPVGLAAVSVLVSPGFVDRPSDVAYHCIVACARCESLRGYRRDDFVMYESWDDDAARAHGELRLISDEGIPGSGFVRLFECTRCAMRWCLTVRFDHGTELMKPA